MNVKFRIFKNRYSHFFKKKKKKIALIILKYEIYVRKKKLKIKNYVIVN